MGKPRHPPHRFDRMGGQTPIWPPRDGLPLTSSMLDCDGGAAAHAGVTS